jgi:HD domain
VRHHHERYDGRGYPDGLAGDTIPLESRIIFVADAFEAMTSDRPYRKAPGPQHALGELRRHAGTQFDPDPRATVGSMRSEYCSRRVRTQRFATGGSTRHPPAGPNTSESTQRTRCSSTSKANDPRRSCDAAATALQSAVADARP